MKPVAYQALPFEDVCLVRKMNQKQYEAFLNGKEDDDEAYEWKIFRIPEGHEFASIVVDVNGNVNIAVISKN